MPRTKRKAEIPAKPQDDTELLAAKEVAYILRVSVDYFTRHIRRKHKIPFIRVGRQLRFPRDRLTDWINREIKRCTL